MSVLAAFVLVAIYVWTLYSLPSLLTGLIHSLRQTHEESSPAATGKQPFVSVVVPAKNEEKVIGRLLETCLRIDYPPDRFEIVVVEDGSTDRTQRICESYAKKYPGKIRFFHRSESNGKPSSLNFALQHSQGEIVGIFDADSVLEPSAVRRAVAFLREPSAVAVQGMARSLNSRLNFLTRLISYEEQTWQNVYIAGKSALRLFVPFTGSCLFVKRSVLQAIGGWDEGSIAEDVELAARLLRFGYIVRYAPSVVAYQESPSELSQFFNQRTRWFRGYMETAIKYGVLLLKPSLVNFDAEMTMTGSFMMTVSLIGYLIGLYSFLDASRFSGGVFALLGWSASCFTVVVLTALAIAAVALQKPRRLRNLLWIPLIYGYWFFQAVIASRAFIQIVLGRPRIWSKTSKSGITTPEVAHEVHS